MHPFGDLEKALFTLGCRFRCEIRRIQPRFSLDVAGDEHGPFLQLVVGHDDDVIACVLDSCPYRRNLLLEIRAASVDRDPDQGCWIPGEFRQQILLVADDEDWRLRDLPADRPVATVNAARTILGLDGNGGRKKSTGLRTKRESS